MYTKNGNTVKNVNCSIKYQLTNLYNTIRSINALLIFYLFIVLFFSLFFFYFLLFFISLVKLGKSYRTFLLKLFKGLGYFMVCVSDVCVANSHTTLYYLLSSWVNSKNLILSFSHLMDFNGVIFPIVEQICYCLVQ